MNIRIASIVMFAILLTSCGTPRSANGVYRPGKFGIESYVKDFPILKATKQEVLDFVGIPEKTNSDSGIEYLSVKIWGEGTYGLEMNFLIKDGVVIDVISRETTVAWGTTTYRNSTLNGRKTP